MIPRRVLPALLFAALRAAADPIGDLPGEDVSGREARKAEERVQAAAAPKPARNWLAAPVEEQLARERTLIPMGKGAIYVPTFSEPRREPEVTVTTFGGKPVASGTTGERILVDSGSYTVRLGSGTAIQQMTADLTVNEGHTSVVPPTWGGLLVETLTPDGTYFEGEYEVIRTGRWVNYGKGRGLSEERLQDIKVWLLPPGIYRISGPGVGFNSLRNFITVQINPGELSQVELIYDKVSGGEIIGGGIKTLNTRVRMGGYWTLGLRAGGNVNLTRVTDASDVRKEAALVSDDLRLRLQFDNALYLGTTELFLQDNFTKVRGRPLSVTSDIAELRTTWIRRLLPWLGPYVRSIAETHLFETKDTKDSIYIAYSADSAGTRVRRTRLDTSGTFVTQPAFDPFSFREGIGVNLELASKYWLDASTQVGLAARQTLADRSYLANTAGEYDRAETIYEIGAEGTLNGTLRLGSDMTLDLRLELFMPDANPSRLRLEDLTADFRFFLTRNLEIGYLYQIKENAERSRNRFPSSHNLSLRLSFNY